MKTPRSDEAKVFTEPHGYEMVPYCLARQLEIELEQMTLKSRDDSFAAKLHFAANAKLKEELAFSRAYGEYMRLLGIKKSRA